MCYLLVEHHLAGSLVWFVPCVSGVIAAAVNKVRKTLAHNIFSVSIVDDRGLHR